MNVPFKKLGFTLIELLIVMTIVSIIVVIAMLSFGDFGAFRRQMLIANQFKNSLDAAKQQAILTAQTLRLYITKKGYYYRYSFKDPKTNKTNWRPLPADAFSNQLAFDTATVSTHGTPPFLVSPNGTLTSFTITLDFGSNTLKISSTQDGEVHIEKK